MHYDHVRAISRSVGATTVRSSGIQPWGDVVVLARTATGWQRINLDNGSVTFCRRTRRGNVAELFVIADNTTVTARTPAPTESADRPRAPHTAP